MNKVKNNRTDVILRENSKIVNEFALLYYIDKVISESTKAENRPNDVRYQYIIIGNDLLFVIKSKYQKIRRRIEYRLLHNLERNFGLRFNLIDSAFSNSKYGIYEGIDPNRSFMEWNCFKQEVTIFYCNGIRPNGELGRPHLELLKENGFDYSSDKNWNLFEEAYEKAYGELPIMAVLKMQKECDGRYM